MTITISPDLEARLRERAAQEGTEPDAMAETLLQAALDGDRAEAVAGIRRGLDASAAGRVRPAAEVFDQMRERLSDANRTGGGLLPVLDELGVFHQDRWDAVMDYFRRTSAGLPALPDEALTREALYRDHD